MPKKLENIEQILLDNGRSLLFEKGYQNLTIRAVAKASGVAPGTVYNYFESKDYFLNRIIFRDWEKIRQDFFSEFKNLTGKEEKANVLFRMVRALITQYNSIWSEYSGLNYGVGSSKKIHDWFISSLVEDFELSWFVVEVIVHFATLNIHDYADIEASVRKLL